MRKNEQLKVQVKNGNLVIENVDCLDIALTLDCGQAFRWKQVDDDELGTAFNAVAGGRNATVSQKFLDDGTSILTFKNQSEQDADYWIHYFDLDRDYAKVCSCLENDEILRSAITEFPGIRILNQDPFETLISFIISQNNNIPRIKGIIDRLCKTFGEEVEEGCFSFPAPEVLASLSEEDLAPLRAGFRNKYILDAARCVANGTVDLSALKAVSLAECEESLKLIKGVGPKVAQCVSLYSLEHIDAFPVDVWVKRIMSELYPNGLPACAEGVEGIAQQFLFHWRRNSINFK